MEVLKNDRQSFTTDIFHRDTKLIEGEKWHVIEAVVVEVHGRRPVGFKKDKYYLKKKLQSINKNIKKVETGVEVVAADPEMTFARVRGIKASSVALADEVCSGVKQADESELDQVYGK
uniref:Uncharacterized protein n=1 Tax=Ditylenchus dipsaci TaxID=166011 RepID=A0A915D4Q3_9BILA